MCPKCHNTCVISTVVCGLCEENLPHSSCDDTWTCTKECDCRPLKKFNYDKALSSKYIKPVSKGYLTGKEKLLAMLVKEWK